MSPSFLIALLVAIMVVAYWRVALLLLIAFVLALLATGIGTISGAIAGQVDPPAVIAPAQPPSGSDDGAQQSDSEPRTESGPSG